MSEVDPLLAAVEALTKPTRTKHVQDVIERWTTKDEEGVEHEHAKITGQQTVTIEHAPLLDQFRDAVNPSTNTTAGASALASMRNVLDSTALYEYTKIASQTADWCRIVHIDPVRDARLNLVHWYPRFRDLNGDDQARNWYATQLRSWANLIRSHLDPPKRRDILYPCPVCGKTAWSNGDEGGMWPLELRYRIDDDNHPIPESVICRACDPITSWPTASAVAELLTELEERHA